MISGIVDGIAEFDIISLTRRFRVEVECMCRENYMEGRCLRPPRTPIAHAGLLSFLKLASVQFSFGRRYQLIAGRLGYGM